MKPTEGPCAAGRCAPPRQNVPLFSSPSWAVVFCRDASGAYLKLLPAQAEPGGRW